MSGFSRTARKGRGVKRPALAVCVEDLNMLLEKVYMESGADFRSYKKASIARRVAKRLAMCRCASVAEYAAVLDKDPAEYDRLRSMLTIKVSEFFREPEVFEAVRDALAYVPGLSNGVRAWCCGCASGEEAYSIAILLAEAVSGEVAGNSVVFATDIDPEAIDRARMAEYREESLANVTSERRDRHFIMSSNVFWKVSQAIRSLVRFGTLDIVKGHPISKVHLLFCRNVFIYFNQELQKEVFNKLDYALRPGGLLVMGKAEQVPPGWAHRYHPIGRDLNVFRKNA
ncbi:MAG: protein-glutamate O-methyltransferase CheR [Deltaproteobacteria bacterium]|nr:protein-glutamate O-methyltransferase CheR [Deltaproteobacteria bacterium]